MMTRHARDVLTRTVNVRGRLDAGHRCPRYAAPVETGPEDLSLERTVFDEGSLTLHFGSGSYDLTEILGETPPEEDV